VYAVIEDSGQQFRVAEGDVVNVDLREPADAAGPAKQIQFDRVLLLSDEGDIKVGTPLVKGAKVLAEVLDPQAKGKKIYVHHLRRRKASRTRTGHRQRYLRVRISKIVT